MGVDAGAILIQREWKSHQRDALAIQGQVATVAASSIVGKFKPVVALPAQAAGVQAHGFQTGQRDGLIKKLHILPLTLHFGGRYRQFTRTQTAPPESRASADHEQ